MEAKLKLTFGSKEDALDAIDLIRELFCRLLPDKTTFYDSIAINDNMVSANGSIPDSENSEGLFLTLCEYLACSMEKKIFKAEFRFSNFNTKDCRCLGRIANGKFAIIADGFDTDDTQFVYFFNGEVHSMYDMDWEPLSYMEPEEFSADYYALFEEEDEDVEFDCDDFDTYLVPKDEIDFEFTDDENPFYQNMFDEDI